MVLRICLGKVSKHIVVAIVVILFFKIRTLKALFFFPNLLPDTSDKPKMLIWVLVILHVVGIAGFTICGFWNRWFLFLVPFHLLITTSLLISGSVKPSNSLYSRIFFVGILGYFIELFGVHTGLLFGHYHYSTGLGIKIFEVPPIIGINWILLIYSSLGALDVLGIKSPFLKIVLGAVLITLLDVLIEPVAIRLNFWYWESNIIPLQNYFGWFVTALLLNSLLVIRNEDKTFNKMSLPIFLMQLAFFASLFLKSIIFGNC
jgi:bisanhydrobacterioruberin hydratase